MIGQERPHNHATQLANPLLAVLMGQRFIGYYPVLAQLTGSVKCALLLGHALSWSRHYARSEPQRDGWFWQTTEQWRHSTGLSRHEQIRARVRLRELGLMSVQGRGMPRRIWYRIELDNLATVIGAHVGQAVDHWSWSEAAVRALLGRPVPCYKPLIEAGRSVTAGLYLSWLCALLRSRKGFASERRMGRLRSSCTGDLQSEGEHAVWLDITTLESQSALAMGRYQLEAARAQLVGVGLIAERWGAGVPARKLTRIEPRAIIDAIVTSGTPERVDRRRKEAGQSVKNASTSLCLQGMAESANPACAKADDWNGGFVHSSMQKSGRQGCRQADDMLSGLPHPLYGVKTSKQLPTAKPDREGGSNAPQPVSRSSFPIDQSNAVLSVSALELPQVLSATERASAMRMLERLADRVLAQQVADEWSVHRESGRLRSPMSYLSSLIALAIKGQFVASHALNRARSRNNAAALEAARRRPPQGMNQAGAAPPQSSTERSRPSAAVMASLTEMRRKMGCVTTR